MECVTLKIQKKGQFIFYYILLYIYFIELTLPVLPHSAHVSVN